MANGGGPNWNTALSSSLPCEGKERRGERRGRGEKEGRKDGEKREGRKREEKEGKEEESAL